MYKYKNYYDFDYIYNEHFLCDFSSDINLYLKKQYTKKGTITEHIGYFDSINFLKDNPDCKYLIHKIFIFTNEHISKTILYVYVGKNLRKNEVNFIKYYLSKSLITNKIMKKYPKDFIKDFNN